MIGSFFLLFFTSLIWYCFMNVEMSGGNLVNKFNPPNPSETAKRALTLVSGVISKKGVCVTEWRNPTDNWTFPALFSPVVCSPVLLLVGQWLRRNVIGAVLSAPNHISFLLAGWIYQARGEEDTTSAPDITVLLRDYFFLITLIYLNAFHKTILSEFWPLFRDMSFIC